MTGQRYLLFGLTIFQLALFCISASAQNANFTADVTTGCYPVTVNFTDLSSGPITSWSWNFGNGNSSQLRNPGAVYTTPGIYTVTLTVSNGSQSDQEVKTGFIVVRDYPSVNFTFDKNSGCSPLNVQFSSQVGTGTGAITEWLWVFGDGGTSTEENPLYTFNGAGQRTVGLKVKNQYGCESTKNIPSAIHVNGPAVDFAASATSSCQVPFNVNFTDHSTGAGALTYNWNFGNGQTSTSANPSTTFTAPGAYQVSLNVSDNSGCSSHKELTINAGNEGGIAVGASLTRVCIGQTVNLSMQSTEAPLSWSWDFGNGIGSSSAAPTVSYNTSGKFAVTLTAQLPGRLCQSIASKEIEVISNASPNFTHNVDCANNLQLRSTSTNASRLEWLIGGTVVSTSSTFKYPTPGSGDMIVRLIAYNSLGCPTVLDRLVHVPALPVAKFEPFAEQDCALPSLSVCAPFTIDFQNKSTSESVISSRWTLGQGITSTQTNPSRTFTTAGTFDIELKVTDNRGCKDSVSRQVHVSTTIPSANFEFDKDTICVNDLIKFTDKSSAADFYCWDFGDGTGTTEKDPQHAFALPGVYNIRLTAKNAGCSNAKEVQQAVVVRNPYVGFQIFKSCDDPFHVSLVNTSINADSVAWEFPDGSISNATNENTTFNETGTYQVMLHGYNRESKCLVDFAQSIVIQDVRADFALDNETPCRDVAVIGTDHSEFAVVWSWLVDDLPRSIDRDATLSFGSPGPHTVRLVVSDSDGCTDEKLLAVNVPDIVGSFSTSLSSDCDALTVNFVNTSVGNPAIDSYNWNFGDGGTSDLKDPIHIFHQRDTFDVSLQLTNASGTCAYVLDDAIAFTIPVPDFLPNVPNACIGQIVSFSNNSANASSYHWEVGNGAWDQHSPLVTYQQSGDYDITLTARDLYGCEQSLTRLKAVHVWKPHADFEAFQTSGECPPLTSIFHDLSTGASISSWSWNFGNGTMSNLQNPANIYTRAGVYDVSLTVKDLYGCFDTKIVEDLIEVGGPSGNFSADVNKVCIRSDVDFIADAENTKTFHWDFGDGNVVDTAVPSILHAYVSPSFFHPSLSLVDNKGCQVIADGNPQITVYDTASVEMVIPSICVFEGEPLHLEANEINNPATDPNDVIEFHWTWNGETIGEGQSIDTALPTGVQNLVLHAYNNNSDSALGCESRVEGEIRIHGKIEFIPNVFTENGDGYNQQFVVPGIENSEWQLHVYNRWGKEVYTQGHYDNTWNGNDLASGVYFYALENQTCPDRMLKGVLTIMH